MKLISWNVNGLRACLKKGFEDTFNQLDADVFCIQETKMQPGQADFAPEGYTEYINSAEKKGYSGTLIIPRKAPERLDTFALGWKPTATKAVPSHWNLRITTSSMSMYPTPKTSWPALTTACSGRTTCAPT